MSESQKEVDLCAMPNEMVDTMCKTSEALGKPAVKADGTFTFDYFCRSQNHIMTYWFAYAKPSIDERTIARRMCYGPGGGNHKVNEQIIAQKRWEEKSIAIVNDQFYKFWKVDHPAVLDKSRQLFIKDDIKREEFEKQQREVREQIFVYPPVLVPREIIVMFTRA